jgi:hypothetical protein
MNCPGSGCTAPFPHDTDYDFGDANHLPIVPVIVEDAPDHDEGESHPGADSPGEDNRVTPNP